MAKNNNVKDFTRDIADAIRIKKNKTDKINPQDFSSEILSIQTGDYNVDQIILGDECEIHITDAVLPQTTTTKHCCQVIDYDGTILKEQWLADGEKFTLPDLPTHDRLIAQEFASPVDIVDNGVIVNGGDIIIGVLYTTKSGVCEFDISLTKATGLTVGFHAGGVVDWGDGTSNSSNVHTYSNYGNYTIKWNGSDLINAHKDGGYGILSFSIDKPENYLIGFYLSDTVTSMFECFYDPLSLKYLTFSKSLTSISGAITCRKVKCVTLPSRVNDVNVSAETVVLQKGITSAKVVYTSSHISIPDTMMDLTLTPRAAKDIYIPDSVETLKLTLSGFVDNIRFSSNLKTLSGSLPLWKEVVLPNGIVDIPSLTCRDAEIVTIPDSVTTIGSLSCDNAKKVDMGKHSGSTELSCRKVIELKLSENLTTLESGSLSWLECLEKLIIPPSVTTIGALPRRAYKLELIDFSRHTTVPYCEEANIDDYTTCGQLKIVVPDNLYDTWINNSSWKNVANYIHKASEVVR
jgi:hypothetical protein